MMKRIFYSFWPPLLAGACLRLFFVLKFPAAAGDTVIYDQLATYWVKLGQYAMAVDGQPTPVDIRMPGYPAFLAIIYALTGRTGESARLAVRLAQLAVDLATCLVIAWLAALLVNLANPRSNSKPAFITALWLAALCPFTANYVAVPLTEVWATLLTALAFVFLVLLVTQASGSAAPDFRYRVFARKNYGKVAALGGFVVGLGTLFRPETPLLLVTVFLLLGYWKLRRGEARRWLLTCVLMSLACGLPLLPWIIRNAVTLGEFQPLAPKDTTLPSEVDPNGFLAWERTWLYRMRDCYLVSWKLNEEEIHLDDIPSWAFDTPGEKERVAMVLERYNDETTWTAEEDAVFAQLARERTARYPLRTYLWMPLLRGVRMWFTPRIELLPVSGHVFPLAYMREEDPVDQEITILFFLVNVLYLALAIWGASRLWQWHRARAAIALLVAYILVRTAFLTTLETPEPRYVLECFPALIALAASGLWARDGETRGAPPTPR
jgi:hypothetical protein